VEADRISLALQHRALQVVVEQHPGHPAPGCEGRLMSAQKVGCLRASRKKRRKILREKLGTMTNAIGVRSAFPIVSFPKWPQSTWLCSPGRVFRRR
jgi:hypothetical protein